MRSCSFSILISLIKTIKCSKCASEGGVVRLVHRGWVRNPSKGWVYYNVISCICGRCEYDWCMKAKDWNETEYKELEKWQPKPPR